MGGKTESESGSATYFNQVAAERPRTTSRRFWIVSAVLIFVIGVGVLGYPRKVFEAPAGHSSGACYRNRGQNGRHEYLPQPNRDCDSARHRDSQKQGSGSNSQR